MTFKDLNITGTSLFRPRFDERIDYYDRQHYNYLLPFQVNDDVYLVDTYHIGIFGSIENYLKNMGNNENYTCESLLFAMHDFYTHIYKILSFEDLNERFELICDLKDYDMCGQTDFCDYSESNRKGPFQLESCGCKVWLIKKGSTKEANLQINNLIASVHTLIEKPKVLTFQESRESIKKANELIKENPNCDYNKDMYDKVLKWYDYMRKIIDEIDKKYEEIFFERGK